MSGETVYRAPEQHVCEEWTARGPVGSIWRCDTCGALWRHESVSVLAAGGWYPMSRRAVRRWRRQQARAALAS